MSEFEGFDTPQEAAAAASDEAESEAVELPKLMRASDLLPEPIEDDGSEVPPDPEEAQMQSLPLAQREALKLAKMTPEQKERYDAANADIMSHPAVAAFAREEERIVASKAEMSTAFVAAYRKRMRDK